MKAILKIIRSQAVQVGITTLFGAAFGAVLALILLLLHDWVVVGLLGLTPPPIVTSTVLPAIGFLLVAGHAAVGFGSAIGLFLNTVLGRILHFGGQSAFVWGLFGQAVGWLLGSAFINIFLAARGLETGLLH